MKNKNSILVVSISFSLFISSLFLPAISYNDYDGPGTSSGLTMFLSGSVAILGGGLMEWIVWLANPLAFISMILFLYKKQAAKILSKIAFILAFSFIFWQEILAAENGREATITHLNAGYWLWLLSMLVLMVGVARSFKNAN